MRGGKREGAGRPVGTKRSDKTARLCLSVTPEEKIIVTKFLEDLRAKNKKD